MEQRKNKVVLITGASSGIGEALAREFVRRGADLILIARRAERLHNLQEELKKQRGRVLIAVGDVTRDGDLEAAVAEGLRVFGKIDIAIANAGFGVNGLVENLKLDDYRRQFEANIFGVLRTFYATFEQLKKTKGSFAVIGSVSGHIATPTVSAYCMSKFAVRALADSLRAEIKKYGVAVTLISPGFVRSEIRKVDNRGHIHEAAKDPVPDWLQMPTEKAARKIAKAILHRRRERIVTGHGYFAVWLQRLFPGFLNWTLGFSKVNVREKK